MAESQGPVDYAYARTMLITRQKILREKPLFRYFGHVDVTPFYGISIVFEVFEVTVSTVSVKRI